MKKRLLSVIMTLALCLTLLPTAALAADPAEQFTGLTPGGTYWFDLSEADIPGTVNEGDGPIAPAVPDTTLHWVPFTYAGTVDAYVLKSRSANDETAKGDSANAAGSTDPSNPIGYTYDHSLFIADYNVTHIVSWDELNEEGLIFGTAYASGGVGYTLRTPSVGSSGNASGGAPASNEWDAILDKNSDGIKNWEEMYSWGQDTPLANTSFRAYRGYMPARYWDSVSATLQSSSLGFRPVLELPSADTLGADGLTTVTLDLNGGSIGTVQGHITTGEIHLVTKKGESYTAPSGDGLTRPTGNTGTYFKWQDSSGNLYEPGGTVPADVGSLTALWVPPEQFTTLTPGGTYWFDLSGANIPGNKNDSLPDKTLCWVPFTYAGTVDAYVLNESSRGVANASEAAASTTFPDIYGYTYDHSLFIANYVVTHGVSWNTLDGQKLIFGKRYTSGGVGYTLRAPSAGSGDAGSGGTPASNEWDAILDKNSDDIRNYFLMSSWGQDTSLAYTSNRAHRGYHSARTWGYDNAASQFEGLGFRPVLEILNPDTLGSGGLTAVTLNLNGGFIGSITGTVNLAVKSGGTYIAPSGDGLTRPDGNDGTYFKWQDSSGNLYKPGDTVPAGVTSLTALWELPEQFTTLTPGGTYWFDLSGANIPGTVNGGTHVGAAAVPDVTLHWVPFTYAGTVDAYVLKSRSADDNTAKWDSVNAAGSTNPNNLIGYTYDHSLFIADYNVTHTVSWNDLNGKNLIFGTTYTSGGVDYTLRAPSAGSGIGGSGGTPTSNEWDAILDKNSVDIKNRNGMDSWGQDTCQNDASSRATRGNYSAHSWTYSYPASQNAFVGFRPVLELPPSDTLGSAGLTTVTLNLNGGHVGSDDTAVTVNLAVKSGGTYTAPSGGGLTRPTGIPGTNFKWQDSSGNFYRPGDTVPANVTSLTALWEKDVPTATANDITVTYTGSAVPASAITGTASVDGSWSFENAAPVNVADSSDSVTVVFTPADTDIYETVADTIKVTVNKATPTGTPAYTAITTGGKTLADAALTVGTITPAGGSIAWDLGDSQTVSANTAYNWTYTPADTDNYNNLTGSITPYVVSYSGGGSSESSNTTTKTEKNPDGSTTTTVTDKTTGTVTETTKNTDGSTTTVETKKDGTVTETVKSADGTTGTVVTDSSGEVTEVKASVSSAAVTEAAKTGDAVTLPVEVPAAKTTEAAPAVDVTVPKSAGSVKVEIPVEQVTPGTVAVIVHADGTEEIVSTSIPTETGVVLPLDGSATVKIVDNAKALVDIHPVSHWAEDAVDFVVARGMFAGTSETTFSPNSYMTRSMLMTVLARFDGEDISGGSVWYEKGMEWAKANGVSDGSNPNGNITREQLATMLWRYAESPTSSHSLDGYTDADEISGYALEAMRWANENGIINGYGNGLLGVQDNATRAQVAQMLMNFVKCLNQ